MNFLKGTIKMLKEHGKTSKDVRWIGSSEDHFYFTWKDFEKLADVEYDVDDIWQRVARDLIIVGKDWWIEQAANEIITHQKLKAPPKRPSQYHKPKTLISNDGWRTMKELEKEMDKSESVKRNS